jgi:hypothetical protein
MQSGGGGIQWRRGGGGGGGSGARTSDTMASRAEMLMVLVDTASGSPDAMSCCVSGMVAVCRPCACVAEIRRRQSLFFFVRKTRVS